jgi:hypothetical protein|tara:strand:+ start:64 stop:786 length:723 start_codon:yes stop_codon:yes gene_type:complete
MQKEDNNLTWDNFSPDKNSSFWDNNSTDDSNTTSNLWDAGTNKEESSTMTWEDSIEKDQDNIPQEINTNENIESKNLEYYVGRENFNLFSTITYNILSDLNKIENEIKTQIELTPRRNSNEIFDFNPSQDSETGKIINSIFQIGVSKKLKIQDCFICMTSSNNISNIFPDLSTNNFIFPINNINKNTLNLTIPNTPINNLLISTLSPNSLNIIPGWGVYNINNSDLSSNFIAICGNYQQQ